MGAFNVGRQKRVDYLPTWRRRALRILTALRGVVFSDAGTVEREVEVTTIRSSIGAGFRLILPILGNQMPLAVDFAYPMTKTRQDDTQVISFSFGYSQ